MKFGALAFSELSRSMDLVPNVVFRAVREDNLPDVLVSEIDATLADTATFCEAYAIGLEVSANCVIVEATRADKTWYAACVVLATDRADINGTIRRQLGARKLSFAPMDQAVRMTGMEYGGITPIGLPSDWPILIDSKVNGTERVIIGSGLRSAKLLVSGSLLASLSHAMVLDIIKS